ncbi:MAG: hypothetical protein JXA96_06365 [Sedimentisphaerales bacterium]|nr:hypothetical protein [Sedimentisphaerales bacterium]
MKRTVFCITILICLSGSVTFGIAPVGQPSANLFQKGWWSLGVDYSMSKIDLNAENTGNSSLFTEGTVDGLDINLLLGKAGYGIKDNWEVFVGFGIAKSGSFSDEKSEPWGNNNEYKQKSIFELDGSSGHAAQIGTKYTFYEKSLIKAGVACQLTWLSVSGTVQESVYKEKTTDGSMEFIATTESDVDADLYIFQIAPGISYEISYGYSIFGGPLFQWVNGTAKSNLRTNTEVDITNDSAFGGWIGLHADIDVFTSLNLEYQTTGSSSTIGFNFTSKF